MQTLIWLTTDWERFINYDSYNLTIPENTAMLTITDLPTELIEAIKEATFEEVEKILCNYI